VLLIQTYIYKPRKSNLSWFRWLKTWDTVKSFIYVRHLILCILWVGQSTNLRSIEIPIIFTSLVCSSAYNFKSTNLGVHEDVQCRQTTKLCTHEITWLYSIHVLANVMTISRTWCKTIITTSFYIRSYNSFAPIPRFARTGYRERKCKSAYLHQTQQGDLLSHKDLTGSQVRLQAHKHNTCKINSACTIRPYT